MDYLILSDFTEEEEAELTTKAGAAPVGLGLCRLGVETATVALLASLRSWCFGVKVWRWMRNVDRLYKKTGASLRSWRELHLRIKK